MFTLTNKDNITLRNLEEQVQKNKEDIARHYEIDRAESNLGIKIIGQVSTAEELPDPLTYTGEYGDTYAVGYKAAVDAGTASYDYWVFTRPTPNTGVFENQWLNVGKISIVGPKGDTGKTGPQGETGKSTKWYTGAYFPSTGELTTGDMYLNNQGAVFQYNEETGWQSVTNIQGPIGQTGKAGERGEKGDKGDQGIPGPVGPAGGFINIYGILSNESQLPTPQSLNNLTAAYLVGDSNPRTLWIQVSSNGTVANAMWREAGPFNTATQVTVSGQYVSEWNADTKRDKLQPEAGKYKLYSCGPTGNGNDSIEVGEKAGQIPHYFSNAIGSLNQPATGRLYAYSPHPDHKNGVVTVDYADRYLVSRLDYEWPEEKYVYGTIARNDTGGFTRFRIQNNDEVPTTPFTIPVYRNGELYVKGQSQNSNAAVSYRKMEDFVRERLVDSYNYYVIFLQSKTTGKQIMVRVSGGNGAYVEAYGYQGPDEEEASIGMDEMTDDEKGYLQTVISTSNGFWSIPTDEEQESDLYMFRAYSYGLNWDDFTITADIVKWTINNSNGTSQMQIMKESTDWYIIGLYSDV